MYKRYCSTFSFSVVYLYIHFISLKLISLKLIERLYHYSFSVVYLCIHFISLKKKDERVLFYSTVCIQRSTNFSNGDTRL